jgi:cyclopropane-fatty-acyl-phospholipid synthase
MHDNTLGNVSRNEAGVVRSKGLSGGLKDGLGGGLRNRFSHRVDEALLGLCQKALRHSVTGGLRLSLPSGATALIGRDDSGAAASLELRSYRVLWNALRRGSIGFAESYMAEDARSDELLDLFGFFIANKQALHSAGRGQFRVRWRDRMLHALRRNTRTGSQRNIEAHYDLGNDFYRLWLDPEMTYSSGLYETASATLETAQDAKYDRIIDALELEPGHRILEIGCGWGGFARRAAERGYHVTGLTLQAARARMAELGLAERTDVCLQDYRDATGTFDRIVSIEMIEAVGAENWPTYFKCIHDRLTPGGIAVLQGITIAPQIYTAYRRKPDFVQRYIFPGGMLPTQDIIREQAEAVGLEFECLHNFGHSYARTLAEWRQRFHVAWPEIAALPKHEHRGRAFDERFRRMWDYYFAYCEAGFAHGTVDVGIFKLRKPASPARLREMEAASWPTT